MSVAVDCPKCDGKMVPLSSTMCAECFNPTRYEVVPYAEWRCVKCGYSVKAK